MAWRFKASKYKNAAPIVPKPEACIRDISVGSYQTYGNNITASAAFMAFNVDHNGTFSESNNLYIVCIFVVLCNLLFVGSSLAVLPLEDCGRKSKTMPLLHAHADTVTDMEFSPFHDGLLATSSQDCLVNLTKLIDVIYILYFFNFIPITLFCYLSGKVVAYSRNWIRRISL